ILVDYPPAGFIPIGSFTWVIGDLNPGSTGSVSLSGTVTALPNSTLTNSALLTGISICPSTTITASASCTTYIEGITNLPDLIITRLNISPNRPIFEGDRINIVSWIKNIGSITADNIEIRFLDEGEDKGTKTINRLRTGQQEARQMNWRIYPSGTHTISVIADPDDAIPEIREDNNTKATTIFVRQRPNRGLLMGTVSDKTSGKVLPDALVIAIGKSLGLDTTDNNGRYIIGDLIPGKYLVIAGRSGYIPEIKTILIILPPPNTLNFELKKSVREGLSFDELYSLILSSLKEDKSLSEGLDSEFSAFSAASFLSSKGEPILLEEPGTASLKLEGGVLKANLKNISIAKIEVSAEIEQGDLLKERSANMMRTTEKEGVTGEGILARLKIEPAEEPIEVNCSFIDCLGNTFSIQESIEP
ncbi:MAG: CARDB domain-containing protein, partial [Candidatus Desantisbacteria bacterium]